MDFNDRKEGVDDAKDCLEKKQGYSFIKNIFGFSCQINKCALLLTDPGAATRSI